MKHIKTVVFISSYFNHHQKPLSDALYQALGEGYTFIETREMADYRKQLGYGNTDIPPYVVRFEENMSPNTKELIDQADLVLIGSAPIALVKNRLSSGRLVFRYSERLLKRSPQHWKYPVRFFTWRQRNPQAPRLYMLCASAYTSFDYGQFGLYRNKCYKWGYFPEAKTVPNLDELISSKEPASLLWVGRMIEYKSPETAIEIARRLKADGYQFSLTLRGTGELEEKLCALISSEKLEDCVFLPGSCSPEEVRQQMEQSEIFLFTSNREEGWGAVLNEAMNSACAVVASHAIGSVPFLLKDKSNGLVYKDGDTEDLYQKVRWLLDHPDERKQLSRQAYQTITEEWNAEKAATRFLTLSEHILNGQTNPSLYETDICSKAEYIKDNWYKG